MESIADKTFENFKSLCEIFCHIVPIFRQIDELMVNALNQITNEEIKNMISSAVNELREQAAEITEFSIYAEEIFSLIENDIVSNIDTIMDMFPISEDMLIKTKQFAEDVSYIYKGIHICHSKKLFDCAIPNRSA